ncbi:hypothetical protein INT45_009382 [Circinella minor]|uniref:C2H2-type domain-containing protein n=1 Tax=Circinella minor TaxID=1195481 RepID=A0A8H7S6Y3_9FUNG|nr:hypothetical protein INT45_009382 [Circinella minor]
MYIIVGIHGDNQVLNNSNDIKLPPLRDIDSPSPSLKTLYPKQHHDHYHYHEDSTTIAATFSFSLTGAATTTTTTGSPISSASSSSSSPCTNEVTMDDSNQHVQQPYSISKCKHFHGRSLSADDSTSISFSAKPPWISKPLRIITATADPTLLSSSTTTTSTSRKKHHSTSSMTRSFTSSSLSRTSSPSTYYHHDTINIKSMHPQKPAPKYACTYCRKVFTRPSSLRTHVYSHTGQKPFACTFSGCDKHFSVLSNMRRHMRRHSVSTAFTSPSTNTTSSPSSSTD